MNLEKWKRRELLFVSLIYFKYESRNKKMKVIKISKESILWKKLKKTCTNVKSAELAVEAVAECNRVRGAEILGAVCISAKVQPASHTAGLPRQSGCGDTNRGLRAKQAAFGSSLTSAFSSRASSPCPLY